MKIGHIHDIWRYPVKAMAGERIGSCFLGAKGLAGDRQWALRDEMRQEIQSCKTRPQLLQCQARYRETGQSRKSPSVEIRFADGSIMDNEHPDIDARLSKLVGRASTLQALRPASDTAFYRRYKPDSDSWIRELEATFERRQGEPLPDLSQLPTVLVDHVSVPGSLFLVAPLHILTVDSLTQLRNMNPASDWDPRRFRPNLIIEIDREYRGVSEDGWNGRCLRIGEAIVMIVGPTPRCGAITRAQSDLGFDANMLRTVVRCTDQNLGVYGEIKSEGLLHTGDHVVLLPP